MKTKPKHLTRGQAWRKIGNAYRCGKCYRNPFTLNWSGLCYAIEVLIQDDQITMATLQAMKRQLHRYRREHNKSLNDYWFPLTKAGTNSRINLCKAFAGGLK